jgi:hypothetical protein
VDQLGPNALGETLEPGRVTDCYLGLLLPPQPAGGNRRVRYRGLVRNQLGLTLRIAAQPASPGHPRTCPQPHWMGSRRARAIAGPGSQTRDVSTA